MVGNNGIPHFGAGGMFDYLLAEIAFYRYLDRSKWPITGQHEKGQADYQYDAPFYFWDMTRAEYAGAIHHYGLKCNRQELRA